MKKEEEICDYGLSPSFTYSALTFSGSSSVMDVTVSMGKPEATMFRAILSEFRSSTLVKMPASASTSSIVGYVVLILFAS